MPVRTSNKSSHDLSLLLKNLIEKKMDKDPSGDNVPSIEDFFNVKPEENMSHEMMSYSDPTILQDNIIEESDKEKVPGEASSPEQAIASMYDGAYQDKIGAGYLDSVLRDKGLNSNVAGIMASDNSDAIMAKKNKDLLNAITGLKGIKQKGKAADLANKFKMKHESNRAKEENKKLTMKAKELALKEFTTNQKSYTQQTISRTNSLLKAINAMSEIDPLRANEELKSYIKAIKRPFGGGNGEAGIGKLDAISDSFEMANGLRPDDSQGQPTGASDVIRGNDLDLSTYAGKKLAHTLRKIQEQ